MLSRHAKISIPTTAEDRDSRIWSPESRRALIEKLTLREAPEDVGRTAAVTIVSRNYLPAARVLRKSFLAFNPGCDFYILLVDSLPGDLGNLDRSTVISLSEISLPDYGSFIYRYTIMEANTAVKPYLLEFMLYGKGYDQVIYLDPDIKVFSELTSVLDGFERGCILLTPHMRAPFHDFASPTELAILQSGTFNLGFVGVKRTEDSLHFLRWWQEKLFLDCIVDIPSGLFVDQKWIDLAMGYFEGIVILRDPSLNVAYWNLHERSLRLADKAFIVDDFEPLKFFHFSGYSPLRPDTLSKHQSRHLLADNSALSSICLSYGEDLVEAGFIEDSGSEYAFDTLPNGVRMARTMRHALLHLSRSKIAHPDPVDSPDDFCRYILTPGRDHSGREMTPLQRSLFLIRPDVAAAFFMDDFRYDSAALSSWLETSGKREEGLFSLFQSFPEFIPQESHLEDILSPILSRQDVAQHVGFCLGHFENLQKLLEWLEFHGRPEHEFSEEAIRRMRCAAPGVRRILNLYFVRTDLRKAFPRLDRTSERVAFVEWLRSGARETNLTDDEIDLFNILCQLYADWLRPILAINNCCSEGPDHSLPTFFDYCDPQSRYFGSAEKKDFLLALASTQLEQQAAVYLRRLAKDNLALVDARALALRSFEFPFDDRNLAVRARRCLLGALEKPSDSIVNFAGMFYAPTGMGEAARLFFDVATVQTPNTHRVALPTIVDDEPYSSAPFIFGLPSSEADLSITLANADTIEWAVRLLPRHYWARKNVGYWLWETDTLPLRFNAAAKPFDEIWTSSAASASAIAKAIEKPVRIMPLPVDFALIESARADRASFGLPDDAVVFGFFFDPKSVLERKNPRAVIEAFVAAFGGDPKFVLLLKVNGDIPSSFEMASLKVFAAKPNVIWYQETISRQRRFDLLKCLDVYCSLHRFEGFGLTCAEAMAAGKPVVATDYSGNTDFMDASVACMVPCEVIPTKRRYGPYQAGSLWAQPDPVAARDMLRSLADADERSRIGGRAREHVSAILGAKSLSEQYKHLCDDLLAKP